MIWTAHSYLIRIFEYNFVLRIQLETLYVVDATPCCRSYRVCHGFRLTKQDDYSWVHFKHFWNKQHFMRQLGQYQKSAQTKNQPTIWNFSLPKSVLHSVVLSWKENSKNMLWDHFESFFCVNWCVNCVWWNHTKSHFEVKW